VSNQTHTADLASFTLQPLHPQVGAEISGLDVRNMTPAALDRVRTALLEYHVLVFRDQRLAPAELVAVAGQFGEPEEFADSAYHDVPAVVPVTNQPGKPTPPYWHPDGVLQPEPPSLTLFFAEQVPDEGGDTLFLNAQTAYDDLPEPDKERLAKLRSVQANGVEHPMVRTHPVSGKKALYLDMGLTVGVSGVPREEAVALFRDLREHYDRPERVYRHKFRQGDLVIWDNVSAAHSATPPPDPKHPRVMLRTTVRGGPTH
jgi:taurine dioxygenase